MAFKDRIKVATEFERRLFEKIAEMGFRVAINGTEHTHPNFVKDLHSSRDQTSLAIRFQPDGVANIGRVPRSFYVEAKAAKTLERLAYEQYTKLHLSGNIVVLVFEKLDWGWCFIEEVPLEQAETTVAPFPKNRRFPIVDGWLAPRKAGRRFGSGSGTQYRHVVPSGLRPFDSFKSTIIERLKNGEREAH